MKKIKSKKQPPKEIKELDSTYWTEYTYVCPKRGKITERIKVKKLKAHQHLTKFKHMN